MIVFSRALGGETSNSFHVHPENWGRWTHFDEHIFSKGLVKPPTMGIVLLCWALIFWRHPNLIRVLWLKTKSRKNIVCRLKLALKGMGRDGNDEIVLPAYFGSCQCTICYSSTVLHSVSEGPFHILLLQDYYIDGSSGSVFFDKWSLFVKKHLKHFVGWLIFSPWTSTIWYTPENIDPEKAGGFQ